MTPSRSPLRRLPGALATLALPALLGGCGLVVLDPAGDVARQQGNLVMISTGLMLLIIIPVMVATALFAWRYRAKANARYEPDWSHSTGLELLIWAAPLLIVIWLGAITWSATHLLDPYRALGRIAPGQPATAESAPLEVQVVALDWKWLFILPEQGVAAVNELAVPVNRQVRFRISSSSVMNAFYIPDMAGMIYAMPGMETKLHGVINQPGRYRGLSSHYSGAGFSGMRFNVQAMPDADFERWVAETKAGTDTLDRAAYLDLEKPTENVPPRRYAGVEEGLFSAVVNMCVEPGKMCMHDMMAIDARGGLGVAGIQNLHTLAYDRHGARGTASRPGREVVASICTIPTAPPSAAWARPVDPTPLAGMGLTPPRQTRAVADAGTPAALSRPASVTGLPAAFPSAAFLTTPEES